MKKNHIVIIIILVTATFLTSCAKSYPLIEDVHNRNEDSQRVFDIYKTSAKYADYEIEICESITEDTANELVDKIEKDIKSANKYLKNITYQKPTIIIVDLDILYGNKLIDCYNIEDLAVINMDSVSSGQYLATVISAGYSINRHWLANGIAGLLLDEITANTNLQEYYSDKNNLRTLDLFAGRFFENIVGDEKQIAIDSSVALLRFIENNYGKKEVVKLVTNTSELNMQQVKNNWLKSMEIEHEYNSIYEGQFDEYIFEPYLNFDIHVKSPFAEYKIQLADYDCLLTSVEGLEKFLYKNKMGVADLKELIKTTNVSNKAHLDKSLKYEIQNSPYHLDSNYYNPTNDVIYISAYAAELAHIHETAHFIVPFNLPDENSYIPYKFFVEGFATYITATITNEYSLIESSINDYNYENLDRSYLGLKYIYDNNCDGTFIMPCHNNSMDAERSFLNYYISHGGTVDDKDDFDHALYMDALSYSVIDTWGKDEVMEPYSYYCVYESFASYIANTYSLDHIILVLDDFNNLENIFGKTFDELINEWIDYLYK